MAQPEIIGKITGRHLPVQEPPDRIIVLKRPIQRSKICIMDADFGMYQT